MKQALTILLVIFSLGVDFSGINAKSAVRWGGAGVAGAGLIVAWRMHKKALALEAASGETALISRLRRSRNVAFLVAMVGGGAAAGSFFVKRRALPVDPVSVAVSSPVQLDSMQMTSKSSPSSAVIPEQTPPVPAKEALQGGSEKEFSSVDRVLELTSKLRQPSLEHVARYGRDEALMDGFVAFSSAPKPFDERKALGMLQTWDRYALLRSRHYDQLSDAERAEIRRMGNETCWSDFFNTLFDVVQVPPDHYCCYHSYLFNRWWRQARSALKKRRPVCFAASEAAIHRLRAEVAEKREALARTQKTGDELVTALKDINAIYRSQTRSARNWADPVVDLGDEAVGVKWSKDPQTGEVSFSALPHDFRDLSRLVHYFFVDGSHWEAAVLKPEVLMLLERRKSFSTNPS